MTSTENWDSVPWMVGGGAQHTPDVGRLVSYAAFGGSEGIIGVSDLAVKQLDTPGTGVQVLTGACAILARAAGDTYQAYAGRLPIADTVDIGSTLAATRSDLIIARVEDPWESGEPWQQPSNPAVGPYIFTRVVSGVPAGTVRVQQVAGHENDTAITLARIDIPANTSTITNAMIVDLRRMVRTRSERHLMTVQVPVNHDLNSATFAAWPLEASWAIDIPEWAVGARLLATWAQVQNVGTGPTYGGVRVDIGAGAVVSPQTVYDSVNSGGSYRINIISGGDVAIPANLRGTTQTFKLMGLRSAGYPDGAMEADASSTCFLDVEFYEAPDNA